MNARYRRALGLRAEQLVCDYLRSKRFQVLDRNVYFRGGEIDVIASKGDLVVICEVRSCRSQYKVHPAIALSPKKVAHIHYATRCWIQQQPRKPQRLRFDVAVVIFEKFGPRIRYYDAAF